MNRKERRASAKRDAPTDSHGPPGGMPHAAAIEDQFAVATAHYRSGDLVLAQNLARAVLKCDSKHIGCLMLLGDIAQQDGRNNLAVKLLGQALAQDNTNAAAHDNIAMAYEALGHQDLAIQHFSLAIVLGLRGAEVLVKQSEAVAAASQRLTGSWPRQLSLAELLEDKTSSIMGKQALLLALLKTKAVCDIELERLLTAVRRALLKQVTKDASYIADADSLSLFNALAQQCFINEYVFALDDTELAQSRLVHNRVVEAVEAGKNIAPLDLIVVAAYLPLHMLPNASLLLKMRWPPFIEPLLTQQIREPLEEKFDCKDIPTLTGIDDATSLQVQNQYEENPYPRWKITGPVKPTTVDAFLRDTMEVSSLPVIDSNDSDILIAGCGTGSHSIDTAQRFPQSRVLAVDISRASLAFARRKTHELGLRNIEYGQADILKLGSIKRHFDVVEAVGVLHHLSDPEVGWRVLLSLLRPNGLMFVGLYSAMARRSVTTARAFITEVGYQAAADDIRKCRQDLIRRNQVPPFTDFFSMSGCRDLLFNVKEHQFTIPQIKTFIDANQLTFLGFEQLPSDVNEQFQQQFSHASARRDLGSWHIFEQAHPLTFGNMYFFWVQKRGENRQLSEIM